MEILLWLIFILLIGKIVLKAIKPEWNRLLNEKTKDYWEDLKSYF